MKGGIRLPRLGLRSVALLALGVLGAFAAWDIWNRCTEISQSRGQQRACAAELRQLASGAESVDLAVGITQSEQALDVARRGSGLFTAGPAESEPAYFELSERLARWREQVRAAGLRIKGDERFGFAAQASKSVGEGPPERLSRRLRAMDRLVAAVLVARPEEVLSWQCVESTDAALAPCLAGGLVSAERVRVVLCGSTATLRALLNELARSDPAWLVHSIEAKRRYVGSLPSVDSASQVEADAASLVMRDEPVATGPALRRAMMRVFEAGTMQFELMVSLVEWTGPARPSVVPDGSRGEAWAGTLRDGVNAGELFTPPTLWFDEGAQRWALSESRVQEARPVALPIKVLAVMPELFRLQLGGYIGDELGGFGVVRNQETQEAVLMRAGGEVPGLGIQILQVARDRKRAETIARVMDVRCGEALELSDQRLRETGTLLAELEVAGMRRRVRAGDEFAGDGVRYRILGIRAAPACIEIEASSSEWAGLVVRTLQPSYPFTP